MAGFVTISPWQRFLEYLFPSRRRARQAKLREGIRWLMRHPEEPVTFDGYLSAPAPSRGDDPARHAIIDRAEYFPPHRRQFHHQRGIDRLQ
jgi:hypothetical protein